MGRLRIAIAVFFGLLLIITIAGLLYRVRHPVDSLQVDPRSSRLQLLQLLLQASKLLLQLPDARLLLCQGSSYC